MDGLELQPGTARSLGALSLSGPALSAVVRELDEDTFGRGIAGGHK